MILTQPLRHDLIIVEAVLVDLRTTALTFDVVQERTAILLAEVLGLLLSPSFSPPGKTCSHHRRRGSPQLLGAKALNCSAQACLDGFWGLCNTSPIPAGLPPWSYYPNGTLNPTLQNPNFPLADPKPYNTMTL